MPIPTDTIDKLEQTFNSETMTMLRRTFTEKKDFHIVCKNCRKSPPDAASDTARRRRVTGRSIVFLLAHDTARGGVRHRDRRTNGGVSTNHPRGGAWSGWRADHRERSTCDGHFGCT